MKRNVMLKVSYFLPQFWFRPMHEAFIRLIYRTTPVFIAWCALNSTKSFIATIRLFWDIMRRFRCLLGRALICSTTSNVCARGKF